MRLTLKQQVRMRTVCGPRARCEMNPNAPSAEDRAVARDTLAAANINVKEISAALNARTKQLQAADQEYQRLLAEHADATQAQVAARKIAHASPQYRLGTLHSFGAGLNGIFVMGDGETFEEALAAAAKHK